MSNQSGGLEPPVQMETGISEDISKNIDKDTNQTPAGKSAVDSDNFYGSNDVGPYSVYVEHVEKSIGRLFPVRVGHYLYRNNEFKKTILDIKAVGRNRVRVILNSIQSANALVNNEILKSNGLMAYIPKFYTQRKGIVRLVDTYFEEDYLKNAIECDRKVMEVRRMKKRIIDKEGKDALVKRQMIIVSFLGSTLPTKLRINGVIFPVEPYVYPVVQCLKCMRYGHTVTLCRSQVEVCRKCAGSHDSKQCTETIDYCIFCKNNDHMSTSKNCPVFMKQKRIKEIMSRQNISFKEAELLENNPSYAKITTNNRFQALSDISNFPPLPATQPSINTQQQEIVRRPIATRMPIQNQNSQNKRRASVSPPRHKKTRPIQQQTTQPNPHRQDFIDYKEKLTYQIKNIISQTLKNFPSSLRTNDSDIDKTIIKETVNNILSDLLNEPSDDEYSD